MERYDPILLKSIKKQSVSGTKYKEHTRTAFSPEYQYFKKRKEDGMCEVYVCKMTIIFTSNCGNLAKQFDTAAVRNPSLIRC